MLNPFVLLCIEFFAAPLLHSPRKRTLKGTTIQEKRKTRNLEIWEWLGRMKQVFHQGSIYYGLINVWKMFIGTHRNIHSSWSDGRFLALPCLQTRCKKRGSYCADRLNPFSGRNFFTAYAFRCTSSVRVPWKKFKKNCVLIWMFWFGLCTQIYILGIYAIFVLYNILKCMAVVIWHSRTKN